MPPNPATLEGLRRFSAAAAAAACLQAGAACAAEAGLADHPEQLGDLGIEHLLDLRVEKVYGASRYLQTATAAPASVTIVTAEEIRSHGYDTLAEVLRSVRGLYVTYDRNSSYFGMRGFGRPGDYNTRVLLLIDGHRMNDNLYDSALIGTEAMLDVDLIERVEVIRGPGSSLYGSNAFFGVINVITRKGGQIDGLELAVEAGSYDSHRERLTYGAQLASGIETTVSATHFDSNGPRALYYPEFDTPENNHGVAVNADADRAHNLYGSVAYRDFVLATGYSFREKQVPTASYGTRFNDGRERTTDERRYLDLSYARKVLVNTRLAGRAYYDRYDFFGDFPVDLAPPGDPPAVILVRNDNYADGLGAELQLTRLFTDRHILIAGAEIRESLNLYQSIHSDDGSYDFRDNRRAHTYGLYAQDEFALAGWPTVNLGLRYDHSSSFGGALSPRFALIAAPWSGGTAKLLFGQAYRAPNAYELYLEAAGVIKANPELGPETIRTYELVGEHYFGERLKLMGSLYRSEIRHLISQEIDPADGLAVFANRDHVTGRGLELGVHAIGTGGWAARMSYALQRTLDRATDAELTNSPRHLAKGNFVAPLGTERLLAGLEVQYSSSARTIVGTTTGGFTLVNVTLSAPQWFPGLELSGSLLNALDRAYAYPGTTSHVQDEIPQDGRSFRLKAAYGF